MIVDWLVIIWRWTWVVIMIMPIDSRCSLLIDYDEKHDWWFSDDNWSWLIRARHLFFPQLGSRTTIKQYGLVRNRNLLEHDDNILPFSKKKSGRTVYLYIYFLFQDYCVWSTLSHNKQLVFFSSSCVFRISVHFDVTGTRNTFLQGIQKCMTLNILIQKVERIRMYSLCSARHVIPDSKVTLIQCWFLVSYVDDRRQRGINVQSMLGFQCPDAVEKLICWINVFSIFVHQHVTIVL